MNISHIKMGVAYAIVVGATLAAPAVLEFVSGLTGLFRLSHVQAYVASDMGSLAFIALSFAFAIAFGIIAASTLSMRRRYEKRKESGSDIRGPLLAYQAVWI